MTRRAWFHGRVLSGWAVLVVLALLPVTHGTNANFTDATTGAASFSAGVQWPPAVMETASWWLDATDPSTLFADSSCATPAGVVGGAAVACWADKQVSGQAVVGSAQVAATPVGGHSAVRFVTTSQLLGPDLFGGSLANTTVFMVSRENSPSNNFLVSLNGTDHTNASRVTINAPYNTTRLWYFDAGSCCTIDRAKSVTGETAIGDVAVFVGWKDSVAGSNGLRLNGGVSHLSPGHTVATSSGGLALGDPGRVASHDIAELIVFGYRLSAADEANVEQYLLAKWTP